MILLATVIEDMLEATLRNKMSKLSPDEDARLFGPDAPLGSFSAKIRMAHALGMLGREQMRMCDVLREMRNACAHSRRSISFKHKALRDMLGVAMAYVFDEIFLDDLDDVHEAAPVVLKLYLMWLVGWLTRYIRTGSEEEATAHIQGLFDSTHQSLQQVAGRHEAQLEQSQKDHP